MRPFVFLNTVRRLIAEHAQIQHVGLADPQGAIAVIAQGIAGVGMDQHIQRAMVEREPRCNVGELGGTKSHLVVQAGCGPTGFSWKWPISTRAASSVAMTSRSDHAASLLSAPKYTWACQLVMDAGSREGMGRREKKVTSLDPGTGFTVRAAWFPT